MKMFDEINKIIYDKEKLNKAKKIIKMCVDDNVTRIENGEIDSEYAIFISDNVVKYVKDKFSLTDEDIKKIKTEIFNEMINDAIE